MNTIYECISRRIKNEEGNHIHIMLICEEKCVKKEIKFQDQPDYVEIFYIFQDKSDMRMTMKGKREVYFAASSGGLINK